MRRVVTLRLVLAGTAAAFMMLTDGATTMGAARAAQPAANPSVPVTRFQRELAHWGCVWQLGTERVTDLNQGYCKGEVYSAMWPNPQAPTIVTHMPEVQGQAPNTNSEVTWRLRQDEVNTMLAAAGLGGATNNVPIPPAMFRLGLDGASDEFFLGTRTAVPESGYEQARDEYLDAPPLTVFRVRPKSNSGDESQPVYTFDPLRVPRLRVAGTGTTELDLNPTLQLLRRRIVDSYPGYEAHDIVVERAFEEGLPGAAGKSADRSAYAGSGSV